MGNRAGWNLAARWVAGAMVAGMWSLPGAALAQSLKEEIVGAWRLVSIYIEENGVKRHVFGDQPVGLLMFDASGNTMSYLARPGLPKFAVPSRLKGTDKEYRDVMQGMIAGFGTYTIDGDTGTIKTISSSYPNRAGTTEKRVYKIVGDELTVLNPTAASGGTAYVKYVRAR